MLLYVCLSVYFDESLYGAVAMTPTWTNRFQVMVLKEQTVSAKSVYAAYGENCDELWGKYFHV